MCEQFIQRFHMAISRWVHIKEVEGRLITHPDFILFICGITMFYDHFSPFLVLCFCTLHLMRQSNQSSLSPSQPVKIQFDCYAWLQITDDAIIIAYVNVSVCQSACPGKLWNTWASLLSVLCPRLNKCNTLTTPSWAGLQWRTNDIDQRKLDKDQMGLNFG